MDANYPGSGSLDPPRQALLPSAARGAYFLRRAGVLVAGFLLALAAVLLIALARGAATACGASDLGASPMTDFSGQILNTGHFWQPTAMAIGQMVMI